ncbi:unnamed protein product [Caenorhabditis brenneri]
MTTREDMSPIDRDDYRDHREYYRKTEIIDECEYYQKLLQQIVDRYKNEEIEKWKKKDPEPPELNVVNGKAVGIMPFEVEESRKITNEESEDSEKNQVEKKRNKSCCTIL